MKLPDIVQKLLGKEEQANPDEKKEETPEEAPTKEEAHPEQEALTEVLKHLNELSENVENKIMQVENKVKEFETRYQNNKELDELRERMEKLEKTLEEFSGVYEVISNQYNPFVGKKTPKQQETPTMETSEPTEKTSETPEKQETPEQLPPPQDPTEPTPEPEQESTESPSATPSLEKEHRDTAEEQQETKPPAPPTPQEHAKPPPAQEPAVPEEPLAPQEQPTTVQPYEEHIVPQEEHETVREIPIEKDHALVPQPDTSIPLHEERKQRLESNKAAHDRVKHINEVKFEDKINNTVEHVGNIHVDESISVAGIDGPKDGAQHVEINPNDPDQISMAIARLTGMNDELKKGIINTIILQKKTNETLQRPVAVGQEFQAQDHEPLRTLIDLAMAINASEQLFEQHVGPRKDHFADWIEHTLKAPALAQKLRQIKDKEKYLLAILYGEKK